MLTKSHLFLTAVASALCFAEPAVAQDAAGRWAVAGSIDGRAFTLDCTFVRSDQALSGACIDGPTGNEKVQGGRSHDLLEGHVAGDIVSWSYETSYLFFKFDAKYSGTLRDDHMSGTIAAVGKAGVFTADRVKP